MAEITKKVIVSRLATYTGESEINRDCQTRLKKLVDEFGLEFTSLAAGMTQSTLYQYIRVKHAPAINLKSVMQAESILKRK